jgi:hypothetical protein
VRPLDTSGSALRVFVSTFVLLCGAAVVLQLTFARGLTLEKFIWLSGTAAVGAGMNAISSMIGRRRRSPTRRIEPRGFEVVAGKDRV